MSSWAKSKDLRPLLIDCRPSGPLGVRFHTEPTEIVLVKIGLMIPLTLLRDLFVKPRK